MPRTEIFGIVRRVKVPGDDSTQLVLFEAKKNQKATGIEILHDIPQDFDRSVEDGMLSNGIFPAFLSLPGGALPRTTDQLKAPLLFATFWLRKWAAGRRPA